MAYMKRCCMGCGHYIGEVCTTNAWLSPEEDGYCHGFFDVATLEVHLAPIDELHLDVPRSVQDAVSELLRRADKRLTIVLEFARYKSGQLLVKARGGGPWQAVSYNNKTLTIHGWR